MAPLSNAERSFERRFKRLTQTPLSQHYITHGEPYRTAVCTNGASANGLVVAVFDNDRLRWIVGQIKP
jgi:hypothetical protein